MEQGQRGGIPAAERDRYDHASLAKSLKQDYLPLNLEQSGLSIQCLEPPVFTIDNFMTSKECQELVQAAGATGELGHCSPDPYVPADRTPFCTFQHESIQSCN